MTKWIVSYPLGNLYGNIQISNNTKGFSEVYESGNTDDGSHPIVDSAYSKFYWKSFKTFSEVNSSSSSTHKRSDISSTCMPLQVKSTTLALDNAARRYWLNVTWSDRAPKHYITYEDLNVQSRTLTSTSRLYVMLRHWLTKPEDHTAYSRNGPSELNPTYGVSTYSGGGSVTYFPTGADVWITLADSAQPTAIPKTIKVASATSVAKWGAAKAPFLTQSAINGDDYIAGVSRNAATILCTIDLSPYYNTYQHFDWSQASGDPPIPRVIKTTYVKGITVTIPVTYVNYSSKQQVLVSYGNVLDCVITSNVLSV